MPLQSTSGAATYDAFGGGVAAVPVYIEDVFSTYLFSGTNAYVNINNGIDLLGKGGLVWEKLRNGSDGSRLTDTARGAGYLLLSNTTGAQYFESAVSASAFYNNGFRAYGSTGETWASWTFRKQPKFFDVVTYTGTGTIGNVINHSLGVRPGVVIAKSTSATGDWAVVYIDPTAANPNKTRTATLNTTSPFRATDNLAGFGSSTFDAFYIGNANANAGAANTSGVTYVAYLFAHNAGGFGLTGTDNVISCGSYTGPANVNLGWEPQWLMIKKATNNLGVQRDWGIYDAIRGLRAFNQATYGLYANLPNTESQGQDGVYINSTGFTTQFDMTGSDGETYIYIAIRRPMKAPTSGASVFAPIVYTGTNVDNRLVNTGIVTDMAMARILNESSTGGFYSSARLISDNFLQTASVSAQAVDFDSYMTPTSGYGNSFSAMNGFGVGNDVARKLNNSGTAQLAYAFTRASSFFDVVCYTGTGANRTVAHNLNAVPELMIVKVRSTNGGWVVYSAPSGATKYQYLNSTTVAVTYSPTWNNTAPTSSVFTVGTDAETNGSGSTFVAYLFATAPGVSKVSSYTGTGATLQIDCGFTGGARFVMIKRTDSTGDWYVWDSARGIVAGNDPYFLLNTGDAEVTSTDYVDTYSAGFEISSTAPAAINANGGSFIFLAIA